MPENSRIGTHAEITLRRFTKTEQEKIKRGEKSLISYIAAAGRAARVKLNMIAEEGLTNENIIRQFHYWNEKRITPVLIRQRV